MKYNNLTIEVVRLKKNDRIVIGNQAYDIQIKDVDLSTGSVTFDLMRDSVKNFSMTTDIHQSIDIQRPDIDPNLIATLEHAIEYAKNYRTPHELVDRLIWNFFELTEDLDSDEARGQIKLILYVLNNDTDDLHLIEDVKPAAEYLWHEMDKQI